MTTAGRRRVSVTLAACAVAAASACSNGPSAVASPSPWLGQDPPGTEPVVFAEGIVSTDRNEVSCAFTPDGRELYFGRFVPDRGYQLLVTTSTKDGWTEPQPAPFASEYSEIDVFITGDGARCFFISKRPSVRGAARSPAYQVWVTGRRGTGWGRPRRLGSAVNSGERELFPTLDNDGRIFFGSDRAGGFGGCDIYMASPDGDDFAHPTNLGPAVNSVNDETDALIAPDGSFVVFTAVDRDDGHGSGDLYVSFRDPVGEWMPAVNLGERINTPSSEFCPTLSPDGSYLFFTSKRRGTDDIFWVHASMIESLRKAAPNSKEDGG